MCHHEAVIVHNYILTMEELTSHTLESTSVIIGIMPKVAEPGMLFVMGEQALESVKIKYSKKV